MSTLEEMALECRRESARLAMRRTERAAAGAPREELAAIDAMLRDMRQRQRVLAHYYDGIRDPEITLVGYIAAKRKKDHDS